MTHSTGALGPNAGAPLVSAERTDEAPTVLPGLASPRVDADEADDEQATVGGLGVHGITPVSAAAEAAADPAPPMGPADPAAVEAEPTPHAAQAPAPAAADARDPQAAADDAAAHDDAGRDASDADDDNSWRPDPSLAKALDDEFEGTLDDDGATEGPGWHLSPAPEGAAGFDELPADAMRAGIGGVGGDLEALLLETENLRLRRELHEERRSRAELEAQLHELRSKLAAAESEGRDWRAAATSAEAKAEQLGQKLSHFEAFATAGLWTRLRGCPPFRPAPLLAD